MSALALGLFFLGSFFFFAMARRSLHQGPGVDLETRVECLEKMVMERFKLSMYHVRGRILECGGCHGLRQEIYKAAESTSGIYREDGCAIQREGADVVIDVVFNERGNPAGFLTSVKNLCQWSRRTYEDIVEEVFEGQVMVDVRGAPRMIRREDYQADDTDSPDGTPSQSNKPESFLSATSPMTRFQSIERPSFLRSALVHKCHLVDKALLSDEMKRVQIDDNLLAMTPGMHSMFDGTAADVPRIRISVADESSGNVCEGRQEVELELEAINEEVADDVGVLLKKGFRREGLCFSNLVVFVKDPGVFKVNLDHKYEQTSRRWRGVDREAP